MDSIVLSTACHIITPEKRKVSIEIQQLNSQKHYTGTYIFSKACCKIYYTKFDRKAVVTAGDSPPSACRLEGRVCVSSSPLQKHPHPVGQIGTSKPFQQDICVTWRHWRQLLERPTHHAHQITRDAGVTKPNAPFTGSLQIEHFAMEQGALHDGQEWACCGRTNAHFVQVRARPSIMW